MKSKFLLTFYPYDNGENLSPSDEYSKREKNSMSQYNIKNRLLGVKFTLRFLKHKK